MRIFAVGWALAAGSELRRTPLWRSSQDPEILWKSAGSESQQLATFPRPVCGDVGRRSGVVAFNPTRWRLDWRRDAGDCYRELPRILLLRRWMNSSGQDSSPIHSGLLLCLVGKTIGDTRRTRVNRNVEDAAAPGAAARATCDVGTLRGTYLFAD